jgi:serine/threonine protein kinase
VKSITVVGIALGMHFVHSFGLVCGNLKPSNILFDEFHRIQIVDIIPNCAELHSRKNFAESTLKVNGVPSEFAAPEVLSGRKLTEKGDVFAFASILFTIVVGHRPFRETGERSDRAEILPLTSMSSFRLCDSDVKPSVHQGGLRSFHRSEESHTDTIELTFQSKHRISALMNSIETGDRTEMPNERKSSLSANSMFELLSDG